MQIVNRLTGEKVSCKIERATSRDISHSKENFLFDWMSELNKDEVYKLITRENPEIIQGLISISGREDFVFLPLIERAGYGKGSIKIYDGIARLLIAFACQISIENETEGCVAFDAKSKLKEYYGRISGALSVGHSNRMVILEDQARKLVTLLHEK